MNNLKIFIILIIIVGITGILENASALSQPNMECTPASICVHPGDFVTYSTEFANVPSIETYTFGDYIGTDKVAVSITTITNGTKMQSNNILNLKTGFYNETSDGMGFPIIVVSPTPINIDKNLVGYSEMTQNFNGAQRVIVTATNNTDTTTGNVAFDKETGVLMYLHLTNNPSKSQASNSGLIYDIKYDLINTNFFSSPGSQTTSQIPSWIKNNAKWWSQGQIGDAEFVQGIQYLVEQGIMKIPQTQSDSSLSQQIPTWVKTNAGWWASGQISDDEFVKAIEYLVSSGIIHV
ncbi:MAG TPA: hypothetical protein VK431_06445 [Nitrosopumilaceae archaeon]|nr:hypothetical protein [Nitrosopumilaceae archaeon]